MAERQRGNRSRQTDQPAFGETPAGLEIQGDVLAENVLQKEPSTISVTFYKMFGEPRTVDLPEPATVRDVLRMCKLDGDFSKEWQIEVDGNKAGLDSPVTDGCSVLVTQKIDGGEDRAQAVLIVHAKVKFTKVPA